jgi:phycobilisome protein
MTAAVRAANRLLEEKDALAVAITDAHYAEQPNLMAKYGVAGRRRCLEDVRYTLEHLIPALDLGQPSMFAEYVQWLEQLLRARRVETSDLVRSLEVTEKVTREHLPNDEAEAVASTIRAGLSVLATPGAA